MDDSKPKKRRIKRFSAVKPLSRLSRFEKLRSLRCFKEVRNRLINGWPCEEVARFIQEDCSEYNDVGRATLKSVLLSFRATIPKSEFVRDKMPDVAIKAAEAIDEGIDELKELEGLYRIQMERINIDFGTEKKIRKLMPTMATEVKTAKDILNTYAQIKMDLGVTERRLGTVDVDRKILEDVHGRYGKAAVAKVLQDPESRRRVLGVAEKMLMLVEKHDAEDAVVVSEESDGPSESGGDE